MSRPPLILNFRDVKRTCTICGTVMFTQARNRLYCDRCKPQAVAKLQEEAYNRLRAKRKAMRLKGNGQ